MTGGATSSAEHELAARVIDTLLREDYADLARQVRSRNGEAVLDLPAGRPAGTRCCPSSQTGSSPTSGSAGPGAEPSPARDARR